MYKGDTTLDLLMTTDTSAIRKMAPLYEGFVRYFPRAMKAVALMSKLASEKHNGKGNFGWSWNRSDDHGACLLRHQLEPETLDEFDLPHAVAVAWRANAQLEKLLVELYGLDLPPAAYLVMDESNLEQVEIDLSKKKTDFGMAVDRRPDHPPYEDPRDTN